MSQDKQQQFINRAKHTLNQSVDELDAVTLARLKAARLNALEHQQVERPHTAVLSWLLGHNKLVLTSVMSVMLVTSVWLLQKPLNGDLLIEDMQILSANDDLELYRNLEFYQWLEYEHDQS